MRWPALLAIVLLCTPLAAQDPPPGERPWHIGIQGARDLGYRRLVVLERTPLTDYLVQVRDESEEPAWGFSAGIEVAWSFHKRWILASGVQYSDRGFRMNDVLFVDIHGNGLGVANVHFHHTFVSAPLLLRWRANQGRLRFEPGIGLAYDRAIEQRQVASITYADGRTERRVSESGMDAYRDHHVTAIAEMGLSSRIGDRIELQLRLRGRYQLTDLVEAPLSAHLYDAGLVLGATYGF